jgi:hypothetical protein
VFWYSNKISELSRLQDTKSTQKNELHFYTLRKNYLKMKLRFIFKNKILRNKFNRRSVKLVYSKTMKNAGTI